MRAIRATSIPRSLCDVAEYTFIAWRRGAQWTLEHVIPMDHGERTLCGIVIPTRATTRQAAAVDLSCMCLSCQHALSLMPD